MLPASRWGGERIQRRLALTVHFTGGAGLGGEATCPRQGGAWALISPAPPGSVPKAIVIWETGKKKKKKEKDSLQPQKYLMQRKQKYLMQYIQTLKVFSERKSLFVSILSLPSSGRAIRNSETLSSAHRVRITVKVREKHRVLLSTHLQVTLIAATVSVCRSRGAERTRTGHGRGERAWMGTFA